MYGVSDMKNKMLSIGLLVAVSNPVLAQSLDSGSQFEVGVFAMFALGLAALIIGRRANKFNQ